MKVLGLVPARAGSKGIPNKNLRELAGKPLLAYTVEAATASGSIDRLILSTDSEAIAEQGRSLGLEVPFMRPAELAKDDTPMLDVAQHAVAELETLDWRVDIMVLLQPTSPLRRPERIQEAVQVLKSREYDSVVSVVQIPDLFAPQKAMRIQNGLLRFWSADGETITRRQQAEPTFAREGTIYACWRDVLMINGSFYSNRCLPLVLPPEEALSLDIPKDWEKAEALLNMKRTRIL